MEYAGIAYLQVRKIKLQLQKAEKQRQLSPKGTPVPLPAQSPSPPLAPRNDKIPLVQLQSK